MKYIYFDASSGLSGDMTLGALLDLGVDHDLFKKQMKSLGLAVDITIGETKRSSLRGLKVDVQIDEKKKVTRKWQNIEEIIQKSSLSTLVKEKSLTIFKKLFEAESRVHGHDFHKAHLHEAGADDAIIDIVGCCFLLDQLKVDECYSSPLNVGEGWVKSSHGNLPVPPPAVAELLREIPVYSAHAKAELVTPTGAAIISTLANKFLPFPEITYEKIGYGAGSRDLPDIPNILRIFYGNKTNFKADKKIYQIEANIDDSSPQVLAGFFDTALSQGALDVYFTPVTMKKNRMATKITLLTEVEKLDELIEAVFKETTSIGVRYYPVERRALERRIKKVTVSGVEIPVKVAYLKGEEVNVQPEYADCLKLAKKNNVPVQKIMEMALRAYAKKSGIAF
jgi:uncharacterized protein (TIGR00299 family) protein